MTLRWSRADKVDATVNYRRVPDADYYHDTWMATPVDGDRVQLLDIKTRVTWAAARVAQVVFPVPSHCESSCLSNHRGGIRRAPQGSAPHAAMGRRVC
jgi:hypothetical protein